MARYGFSVINSYAVGIRLFNASFCPSGAGSSRGTTGYFLLAADLCIGFVRGSLSGNKELRHRVQPRARQRPGFQSAAGVADRQGDGDSSPSSGLVGDRLVRHFYWRKPWTCFASVPDQPRCAVAFFYYRHEPAHLFFHSPCMRRISDRLVVLSASTAHSEAMVSCANPLCCHRSGTISIQGSRYCSLSGEPVHTQARCS
jgi:hypothetical protein